MGADGSMQGEEGHDPVTAEGAAMTEVTEVDVLVAGLGPGGCMAALLAHRQGLSTLAVEARGPEASRMRLVLVRPRAQELLRQIDAISDIFWATKGGKPSWMTA